MRIALIGAGIVGVTTAYELAVDGHEVHVFERRNSIASETSFANAGVVAPGYVTPWAAPGMPAKVLRRLFGKHAAVRFGGLPDAALLGWLIRWRQACAPSAYEANRSAMHSLARYSAERLQHLGEELRLDYERGRGVLVLLRSQRDVTLARPGLKLLTELGVDFHLVDADQCRQIEPGLNVETPLRAGVHLPNDGVGNCRQFALLMRNQAQALGAQFHLERTVRSIVGGKPVTLRFAQRDDLDREGPEESASFDAVVVCAALGSLPLLKPLGIRLPMQPVYGYSVTAPMRHIDGHPEFGPRSALMDEQYKVAISRLGQRLRVAGSAELGGSATRFSEHAMATLYKVLHDWFPATADLAHVQRWKGARPMLPDGPPIVGASGQPGVWLNLGHGSSGWALACGSARLLADSLLGRAPAVAVDRLGIDRLR